jgi:hypothetical protein
MIAPRLPSYRHTAHRRSRRLYGTLSTPPSEDYPVIAHQQYPKAS